MASGKVKNAVKSKLTPLRYGYSHPSWWEATNRLGIYNVSRGVKNAVNKSEIRRQTK